MAPDPAGWAVVWTRQNKTTRVFKAAETDLVVGYCVESAVRHGVYIAVGLQSQQPKGSGRGGEDGVFSVPGMWADIDIAGPAHASKELPQTEQEAIALIEAIRIPPSLIVRTGFGLQPYWLFREPFIIETQDERENLKRLSRRFQQILRIQAQARGWSVDPTADLCRLLRVPGTFNRKIKNDVRQVSVDYFTPAYSVSDIEELVTGLDDPPATSTSATLSLPPAKLPPILDGCVWMRHCVTDGYELPEPQWYRMLTIVARCDNSEEWAHNLSRNYPRYSQSETQRKLAQASGPNVAPVTCAYVQSDLEGQQYCGQCHFRGLVRSPIAIGRMNDTLDVSKKLISNPESQTIAPAAHVEHFTDLGNAKRFAARYRNQLLYCEKWMRWFVWDGTRWKEDETLEAYRFAASMIRDMHGSLNKIEDEEKRDAFLKHLIKSESYRAQAAMLNLAKADSVFTVHPSDLDVDPWLLTVANGTFDLRTGKLGSHKQGDRITKLAPVVHDPSATCPNWIAFLHLVLNANPHLMSFLKRAFGCCLTGISSDKAMFILYGANGDNGKSTMVDAIQLLLGDYAMRTPTETFLRKREGGIPNDIARLKGARFVWASENERGSRLSESLIKKMTGGDKLTARFMRGQFFEFHPEFKLWLATNHRPQIRGDRALWNRLKLIPFEVVIPKEQQKPKHEVMEMFRSELPGILNWALEGCLEWQRDGLGVPQEVIDATREYEAEEDVFAMFLEEKCICVPNACILSLPLYSQYTTWAEQHGEAPMSHKAFASLLSERGFKKSKTTKGALYSGITLREEDRYDTAPAAASPREPAVAHSDDGEMV